MKDAIEEIQLQEEMKLMAKRQEAMMIIKGSQGSKASEVRQGNLHLPSTKVHFLVIVILVQTLVIWQKIVEHFMEIDVVVPDNLQEIISQEEIMNFYS